MGYSFILDVCIINLKCVQFIPLSFGENAKFEKNQFLTSFADSLV